MLQRRAMCCHTASLSSHENTVYLRLHGWTTVRTIRHAASLVGNHLTRMTNKSKAIIHHKATRGAKVQRQTTDASMCISYVKRPTDDIRFCFFQVACDCVSSCTVALCVWLWRSGGNIHELIRFIGGDTGWYFYSIPAFHSEVIRALLVSFWVQSPFCYSLNAFTHLFEEPARTDTHRLHSCVPDTGRKHHITHWQYVKSLNQNIVHDLDF